MPQSTPQPYASPALSDWTSSTASPLLNEKSQFQFSEPRVSYVPISNPNTYSITDERPQSLIEEQHLKLKYLQHYDNLVGYVLSLISVTLTGIMDGIMVYVLYKFYTTRSIPAPGRKSPWAKGTQLWPAFLLLVASFITLCIDLAALIAACFSHRARKHDHRASTRKRAMRVESTFNKVGYAVFVVKWIAVFILYRVGRTSKDLWGWSCDDKAKKIQQYYIVHLNFEKLCTEQVGFLSRFVASC